MKVIIQCLFLLIFLVSCYCTVYFSTVPFYTSYFKKSDKFILQTYPYGIQVTPTDGIYYNFSPYDAYYISKNGQIEKFIEVNESSAATETGSKPNSLLSKYREIGSYFNTFNPKASFKKNNNKLVVSSHMNNNKLFIYFDNKSTPSFSNYTTVLTLTYNDSDILITKGGIIIDGENAREVARITLNGEITILNQLYNGGIKIDPNVDTYDHVSVDRQNKIIEFYMKPNSNQIEVELLSSTKQNI